MKFVFHKKERFSNVVVQNFTDFFLMCYISHTLLQNSLYSPYKMCAHF